MRDDLSVEGLAALENGALALQLLITLHFTGGTLRLTTSRTPIEDLEDPPNTYYALKLSSTIEEVKDVANEVTGLNMTLSGADPGLIAIALGEQVRGRPCNLKVAVIDAETGATRDVSQIWAGRMSTMSISQKDNLASIQLACEHRGVLFNRPKPLRYIDVDQQRLHTGDLALRFIVSQSQKQDVWPAASWFRQ